MTMNGRPWLSFARQGDWFLTSRGLSCALQDTTQDRNFGNIGANLKHKTKQYLDNINEWDKIEG